MEENNIILVNEKLAAAEIEGLPLRKKLSICYEAFEDCKITPEEVKEYMDYLIKSESEDQILVGLRELGVIDFSIAETLCMMMLIDDVIYDGIIPFAYSRFSRHHAYGVIEQGINALLKRGILVYEPPITDEPEKNAVRKNRYYWSPEALAHVFKGETKLIKYNDVCRQTEILPSSTIRERRLYYNRNNNGDVNRLYDFLKQDNFNLVINRLKERGRNASATILLYGDPGTGKTELAYQIARKTGRDILRADISKLISSFHGDSEKNFSELFRAYNYLYHLSNQEPILLFNEADGILGKRSDVVRQCVDKIENRIVNQLLEKLENFEGIFIATTNFANNLDFAFDRRFLYKINLQKPDEQTRMEIWEDRFPELKESDLELLAAQYPFTGGQIENIAKKVDIDYAIYGTEPNLSSIISYCNSETFLMNNASNIEKTIASASLKTGSCVC